MSIPRTDAVHLLRRSGFAATPRRITELSAASDWAAAVDQVMDTSAAPFPAMPASFTDPTIMAWDKWVLFINWWIELMRTTPCPIVDKLALFLHGHHFVCGRSKNQDVDLAWRQIDLFRRNALGDYHALAQAVAVDPWMLNYLDNGTNRAPSEINENFGRELLELFTVGRSEYTEADVVAMSRAWSGHNLDESRRQYVFDPAAHDNGDKTLFGIARNWDGPAALTEAILGVRAVASSRLLTHKLWYFLVGTEPSQAVIDSLAEGFRASGLSLRTLVRSIFMRPEFLSAAARSALVRSPIEWFVAVTAALDIPVADSKPENFLASMGQAPLDPPNVGGWGRNEAWLSTGRWWRRGDCVAYLRWVATSDRWPYRRFANLNQNSRPREVADTMFDAFGIVSPSAATRARIESFAAEATGGWHGWSMRTSAIVLTALSPDFVVGG